MAGSDAPTGSTTRTDSGAPDSTDLAACSACFESLEQPWTFSYGAVQCKNTLRVLPKLAAEGIDPGVLEQLAEWCGTMWPHADWIALLDPGA